MAMVWFVFLTFPFMVVKVNTLKNTVEWRWMNILWVAIGAFVLSALWRLAMERRDRGGSEREELQDEPEKVSVGQQILSNQKVYRPLLIALAVAVIAFPLVFDSYQVSIMVLALIFVVLGLGLNITVGLAGLLDLGYVAFFAFGAYTYGLLSFYYDIGFWTALPIGGLVGALCGVLLGFPILRLRGDYLAIVTLGFGLIAKIVLENWEEVTNGAKGIANIGRPGLFGVEMDIATATSYTYYLMIVMVLFAIFVTNRIKDSRIGRAWMALREDEIACVAMGIDMARTKLSAYAFGAFWAGLVGVIFAARNTYINPNSFTFMESAIVLSIVVLGGMGSILGVIIAALVLILMPEYLRAFAEYRMLIFGAVMVMMMIFRPQGLISNVRKNYGPRGPLVEKSHD
jgi:branched-chain amino acid transport system permease protein